MKTIWLLSLAWALAAIPGAAVQDEPEAQDVEIPAGRLGTFPGYLPAGATKAKPCPLVVACHGHGDTAKNFLACLKGMAKEAGVALLVPEGTEKTENKGFGWNDFPDRAKVIEASIRAMLKAHPVDPKRILWIGHSAGTWVCCEDGAALSDLCHGIILTAAPTATLAKGAKQRVCLFLGTEDPNFKAWGEHLSALKAAKVAYTANRVNEMGHALPHADYLVGAVGWLLGGRGAEHEENTIPEGPRSPEDRGCRHILVRYKGAEGAGADVKRSEKEAEKEAEKLAGLLKKEKGEKRAERAASSSEAEGAKEEKGALTAEAAAKYGAMLRWACWTAAAGEVRVVKSPAGYHVVWAEK